MSHIPTSKKRRLAGLCVACGGPLDSTGVRCAACQDHHREQTKKRAAERYAERRSAGLCATCGKPSEDGTAYCPACRAAHRWSGKKSAIKVRLDRDEAGLCIQCGAARDNETKRCAKCRDQHAAETKERMEATRKDWAAAGKCSNCGGPREPNYRLCAECRSVAVAANHRRRVRVRQAGNVCVRCGELPWREHKTKCRYHFVYDLLHNYAAALGYPRVPEELVEAMAAKLESQEFKCAYTGIPLVVGGNASMDHILPKADRPDLALTAENIVWIDRDVNTAKRKFSLAHILQMSKSIVENAARVQALVDSPPPTTP
jgi:hypothetical protein